MATPDAPAGAKGQAQEDSKTNAIPDASLLIFIFKDFYFWLNAILHYLASSSIEKNK